MKKIGLMLLVVLLTFSMVGCTKETPPVQAGEEVNNDTVPSDKTVADGTYEGKSQGFGGEVKVSVTVEGGAIKDIAIVEHNESKGVSDFIIEGMPQRIIDAQSYEVDLISGATFTANAIKYAVKDALVDAGASDDMFTEVPEVVKKDQELTTDVVVVGSGLAGISAAMEAREAGANVIVVEKLGRVGGNSVVSGGIVYATGSPINGEYDNNPEDMVEYYEMRSNGKADEELVRYGAENSGDTIAWMMENGVEFKEETAPGGLSPAPRAHYAAKGAPGIVMTLYNNAVDSGVEFILESPVTELIVNDGVVSGVVAEGREGKLTINSKAVVMTLGGFDGNEEARDKYAPHAKGTVVYSSYGNSGDYIGMGEAVGAQMHFPDAVMGMKIINKNAYLTDGINILGWLNTIGVTEEGERFENENDDYPVTYTNMLNSGSKDFYWIYDSSQMADLCEVAVEQKYGFKADTLEQLAEEAGMDSEKLVASVERYNSFAGGVDEDFGKEGIVALQETGPYYAIRVKPTSIAGFGGFVINTDSEALDKDGNAIPGLYAAGECASGQFFDREYAVSGTMLNFSTVFGRTAGRNAAEFVNK